MSSRRSGVNDNPVISGVPGWDPAVRNWTIDRPGLAAFGEFSL